MDIDLNGQANLTDAEVASWYEGKTFSSDWTTMHFPVWAKLLEAWRPTDARVIEIGSWEGRSALFFMNFLPRSQLVCIDTFAGGDEHLTRPDGAQRLLEIERRFHANVAGFAGRIEKIKMLSNVALPRLAIEGRQFDIAYIDGSHRAADVYSDAALAWPMLVRGGILIFDDYQWTRVENPLNQPKLGIDSFLRTFESQYRLVHHGYQVAVEKI